PPPPGPAAPPPGTQVCVYVLVLLASNMAPPGTPLAPTPPLRPPRGPETPPAPQAPPKPEDWGESPTYGGGCRRPGPPPPGGAGPAPAGGASPAGGLRLLHLRAQDGVRDPHAAGSAPALRPARRP